MKTLSLQENAIQNKKPSVLVKHPQGDTIVIGLITLCYKWHISSDNIFKHLNQYSVNSYVID